MPAPAAGSARQRPTCRTQQHGTARAQHSAAQPRLPLAHSATALTVRGIYWLEHAQRSHSKAAGVQPVQAQADRGIVLRAALLGRARHQVLRPEGGAREAGQKGGCVGSEQGDG